MKVHYTLWNADWSPTVYLTYQGYSVGLNEQNELVMFDKEHTAILGEFTQTKIDGLCEALQRLKCHLPE